MNVYAHKHLQERLLLLVVSVEDAGGELNAVLEHRERLKQRR